MAYRAINGTRTTHTTRAPAPLKDKAYPPPIPSINSPWTAVSPSAPTHPVAGIAVGGSCVHVFNDVVASCHAHTTHRAPACHTEGWLDCIMVPYFFVLLLLLHVTCMSHTWPLPAVAPCIYTHGSAGAAGTGALFCSARSSPQSNDAPLKLRNDWWYVAVCARVQG